MTDIEITKLCAEAMGWRTHIVSSKVFYCPDEKESVLKSIWIPLKDDAQAMALLTKFRLSIYSPCCDTALWIVDQGNNATIIVDGGGKEIYGSDLDLNRAIVECVAKLEKAKHGNEPA